MLSILQDQGLFLEDIRNVQRIAAYLIDHGNKYSSGSPVKVVAELSSLRKEHVNRCEYYGHDDLEELVDRIGLRNYSVSVGCLYGEDQDPVTMEEEIFEQNGL